MSSEHLRPLWFGFDTLEILWQLNNPDGTLGLWQVLHSPSLAEQSEEDDYFYLWNWYVIET